MITAELDIMTNLQGITFALGRLSAQTEQFHTCANAMYRYPWPLDPECKACKHHLEEFVRRQHLEMAYRLFGWDIIHAHMDAEFKRRTEMAKVRREMGSGI